MNNLRVSQFMPFDSLKGFREAIREKEKIVVEKPLLSEDLCEEINQKLQNLKQFSQIEIIFQNGEEEAEKLMGTVAKIDYYNRYLQVVKTKIRFEDIYSINIL